MRHDSEDTGKYGSNGAGPGRNVQGGGRVSAIIWQQDLVGDRVDFQGPDSVPSSRVAKDHGDDGETRGRWRVGVPSGR